MGAHRVRLVAATRDFPARVHPDHALPDCGDEHMIAVLAAHPRQARALARLLTAAGIAAQPVDVRALAAGIRTGTAAALVVTADMLAGAGGVAVREAFDEQPRWSDLPVILVAGRNRAALRAALPLRAERIAAVIARPLDHMMLHVAARAALRARAAQRTARDAAAACTDASERLDELAQEFADRRAEFDVTNDLLRVEIEDRSRAESRLRISDDRYRLVLRATNDAIRDWDVVAGRVSWNGAAVALFGTPTGEAALDGWEARIHPQDRLRVTHSFAALLDGPDLRWSCEYRFLKLDGGHADILDRCVVTRDEEGRSLRVVSAMTDISEQRRSEARLRRAQDELIHVARLSAMGAMASTLAHELNQPLTSVTNYVRGCRRLLDAGQVAGPTLAAALAASEASALKASEIVRCLRELVANGPAQHRRENLRALIDDACVIALIDAQAAGVAVRFAHDDYDGAVIADRVQIQQVLINLLRNGIEALHASARRELVIATRRLDAHMIEIRVTDSGPGLDEAMLPGLFSTFDTARPDGLGLGLSICRTIVEAHTGTISGDNAAGGGATFGFTLPIAPDGEPSPIARDVPASTR